ncbi:MAG: ATP synthase subunit I [Thiobacillus sp.]|nr:ATP synthase subunit I [Thiobacillus sp.]
MSEALMLGLAGVAGLIMGAIFFGGLWWTVRKGVASQRPALWFVGSFVLRTGVVVAGFYVVSGGQWQRLLACLFGFAVARFIVTWFTPPPIAAPNARTAEARHAP